jgi:hypothetical protein
MASWSGAPGAFQRPATGIGELVVIGFTGTRKGATAAQLRVVRELLATQRDPAEEDWLHHGDATGADKQIHAIARELGYQIAAHPCPLNDQRAFCDADVVHPPKMPLTRNREVVIACERLLATPLEAEPQQRGGIWWTINYAIKVRKPVTIILPNGLIRLGNRQ